VGCYGHASVFIMQSKNAVYACLSYLHKSLPLTVYKKSESI
jgi:hypothetical protein